MTKHKHHSHKEHKNPVHSGKNESGVPDSFQSQASAGPVKTDSSETIAATSMPAQSDAFNLDAYESDSVSSELSRTYQSTLPVSGNEWGYSSTRQKEPYSSSPSGLAEEPFEQDAEFASEIAYPSGIGADPDVRLERRDDGRNDAEAKSSEGAALGWFGLVLAVISLFVWPAVIGTIAVIVGIVAYVRGSRGLGAWTMGIGLVSLLAYFFLVPYYA
ncbi:hypothetical protein [Paenibacillus sp. MBLB4367]|uniref:hypothetical protein n=1 Tax=Paenibacillus sp. MBLB4367 TaxID=3384767 RepID=UPI00390822F3